MSQTGFNDTGGVMGKKIAWGQKVTTFLQTAANLGQKKIGCSKF